ncbi:MAG: prepilin-type N-terminal cleavage/methylation domain-containing protein [Methylohalobius sp.]|nr:prepilin-type N-terminal cleavage/methylation domain-containing protein [Methylohalobius sp.]
MRVGKGFTLLEVLIALALFGLMLPLVFGTLALASRSWEGGEVRADKLGGRMALERFLRQVLGQARVWPGSVEAQAFGFSGTSQELTFIAYLLHTPGAQGLQRFTLYLAPKRPRGQDLKVRIAKADGTIVEGEEEARDQVLLEDVLTVRFAYWEEGSGEPGRWKERWEGTVLPKAVWVEVIRKGENWPPYVIPLPIQMAAAGLGLRPDVLE